MFPVTHEINLVRADGKTFCSFMYLFIMNSVVQDLYRDVESHLTH
jgi:hypothetical protein